MNDNFDLYDLIYFNLNKIFTLTTSSKILNFYYIYMHTITFLSIIITLSILDFNFYGYISYIIYLLLAIIFRIIGFDRISYIEIFSLYLKTIISFIFTILGFYQIIYVNLINYKYLIFWNIITYISIYFFELSIGLFCIFFRNNEINLDDYIMQNDRSDHSSFITINLENSFNA